MAIFNSKRTKTGNTQPKLNVACFVVQFCLTDAEFVIFSNYCLIGTHPRPRFLRLVLAYTALSIMYMLWFLLPELSAQVIITITLLLLLIVPRVAP